VLDTVRLQSTTLGDSDLGTTRFLERFAEGSVTYRQARSSSPWTLPSHASLFTGLYATEHRVSAIAPYLPPHLPTLAERLGAAGYRTVAVSANAWVGPDFGLQRGFERYVRGWQLIDSETDFTGPDRLTAVDRAERFRTALRAAPTTSWPRLFANALYAMYRSRGHFHGSRIARLTVRELEEAATDDRPLFLFVNFLDAHMPYRPPGRHRECFGVSRRDAVRVRQEPTKYMVGCLDLTDRDLDVLGSLYHAEISRLDEIMARFLPRLEVLLGPDAMVVVTASSTTSSPCTTPSCASPSSSATREAKQPERGATSSSSGRISLRRRSCSPASTSPRRRPAAFFPGRPEVRRETSFSPSTLSSTPRPRCF